MVGVASQMFGGIGTNRMHKDVDIAKDQGAFITSSKLLMHQYIKQRKMTGEIPPTDYERQQGLKKVNCRSC